MSRKYLVTETFFDDRPQNFYYVLLPDGREDGFYRDTMTFNAFFMSLRNPKANVTEVRQFTVDDTTGIEIKKKYMEGVDFDNLQTFESMWKFYEFIGYDYKARKYSSGERMKIWNGRQFLLPKRRTD